MSNTIKTKSIRLNITLRSEIVDNIRQAYEINTPCPPHETKTDIKDKLVGIIEVIYREQSAALVAKATKSGINPKLFSESRSFQVYQGNYSFAYQYLKDKNCNNEYLPVPVQGWVYVNLDDESTHKDPRITLAYKVYKAAIKTERVKQAAVKEWKLQRDNYLSDVRNVIDGVNTTGQLLEQWAEVEKFLPVGIVNPSKIQLPAVSIERLNKFLG